MRFQRTLAFSLPENSYFPISWPRISWGGVATSPRMSPPRCWAMWRKEGVGAMVMPAASRAAWNSGSAHSSVMMAMEVSPSMDPALWERIFFSPKGLSPSSRQTILHRKLAQPGSRATPQPAASSGLRPVKYRRGSQPKMERMAVSLPGGSSLGTVRTLPSMPPRARASMAGVSTASRGVFPPNSGTGLSAMPSPITRRYFIKIPAFLKFAPMFPGLNKGKPICAQC